MDGTADASVETYLGTFGLRRDGREGEGSFGLDPRAWVSTPALPALLTHNLAKHWPLSLCYWPYQIHAPARDHLNFNAQQDDPRFSSKT